MSDPATSPPPSEPVASSLTAHLLDSARRYPDRPALRLGATTVTYGRLDERSARVAAMLRSRGIAHGDRVALMLPNVPEFVALYHGVLRAGGVVVPMNPLLKVREVEHHLRDSGASLIFVRRDGPRKGSQGAAAAGVPALDADPAVLAALLARHDPYGTDDLAEDHRAEDLAVILYTSGTTGSPKGAALTHSGLAHNTSVYASQVQALTSDDVILGCLPLFHTFGQTCAMNAAVYAGASLSIPTSRRPPSSASPTTTSARRSPPRSCCGPAPARRPGTCGSSSGGASPPTSTPGTSGSWTACPSAPAARSSSAPSHLHGRSRPCSPSPARTA
ncbi:AMP-binding enzyme [Thermomonospora umbrina]|uniref:AMP-binding enzyme n=1 Tax=Thermomonospora umbrina TaxID=111806 RepID=A0A3D9SJS8_9ACTN|nr:AMP-binding protein [Thermomonospora umbrina]REE95957.1 AMP-binding enzyme [Thermomonospora umbrina]